MSNTFEQKLQAAGFTSRVVREVVRSANRFNRWRKERQDPKVTATNTQEYVQGLRDRGMTKGYVDVTAWGLDMFRRHMHGGDVR